jgi:SAM-dependent methyltransferase
MSSPTFAPPMAGARPSGTARKKAPWKLAEREAFLGRLRDEGGARLLELGAGTGQDSVFFRDQGLDVVAVDMSPQMVARCREKGIDARVMDLLHLDFAPESFDAVYSLNCLLHVPNADLPTVLEGVRAVMRPGGLFLLGVYGGGDEGDEGVASWDHHDPPRFFSWRTDEQLQRFAAATFDIVDFHVASAGDHRCGAPARNSRARFQSLTLRRPYARRAGNGSPGPASHSR